MSPKGRSLPGVFGFLRFDISDVERCSGASYRDVTAHLVIRIRRARFVAHVRSRPKVLQGLTRIYRDETEAKVVTHFGVFGSLLHSEFEHGSCFPAASLLEKFYSMPGHFID